MTPVDAKNSTWDRPIGAALALVVRDARIVLVRRANKPDAGRWGFPGGKVGFGETVLDAASRELCEETGVRADPLRVLTAVDAFDRDRDRTVTLHFVLVAVLCRWVSGEPHAGDDATDAGWFSLDQMQRGTLALSLNVLQIAKSAIDADTARS